MNTQATNALLATGDSPRQFFGQMVAESEVLLAPSMTPNQCRDELT